MASYQLDFIPGNMTTSIYSLCDNHKWAEFLIHIENHIYILENQNVKGERDFAMEDEIQIARVF